MTLADYLKNQGETMYSFAKKMGLTYPAVWNWVNDGAIPDPENMRKIAQLTKGAVTPNDWIPIAPEKWEEVLDAVIAWFDSEEFGCNQHLPEIHPGSCTECRLVKATLDYVRHIRGVD